MPYCYRKMTDKFGRQNYAGRDRFNSNGYSFIEPSDVKGLEDYLTDIVANNNGVVGISSVANAPVTINSVPVFSTDTTGKKIDKTVVTIDHSGSLEGVNEITANGDINTNGDIQILSST